MRLEVPIIRTPEGARETDVPEMIMAGPFGVRVLLPTTIAVGLAVINCPFTVSVGRPPCVLDARTPGSLPAIEITCPETVTAFPPTVWVAPSRAKAEGSSTVTA